jgi:hypothetical protein
MKPLLLQFFIPLTPQDTAEQSYKHQALEPYCQTA